MRQMMMMILIVAVGTRSAASASGGTRSVASAAGGTRSAASASGGTRSVASAAGGTRSVASAQVKKFKIKTEKTKNGKKEIREFPLMFDIADRAQKHKPKPAQK